MDIKEVRAMSLDDINKSVSELRKSVFQKKFEKTTSGIEKTHEVRALRKDIARLLTIANSKKREQGKGN